MCLTQEDYDTDDEDDDDEYSDEDSDEDDCGHGHRQRRGGGFGRSGMSAVRTDGRTDGRWERVVLVGICMGGDWSSLYFIFKGRRCVEEIFSLTCSLEKG